MLSDSFISQLKNNSLNALNKPIFFGKRPVDKPVNKTDNNILPDELVKQLKQINKDCLKNGRTNETKALTCIIKDKFPKNLDAKDLANYLFEVIRSFDVNTAEHLRRVSNYALRIGQRLKLPSEQLQMLHYAALLHDIGKLGIRKELINAKHKISPEEYRHIKQHAQYSKLILNALPWKKEFAQVPELASLHHEKWDGTGYPKGLKKDQIPVISQIISIVDVFDALISFRAYHKPLSAKETLKHIMKNKDKAFNPLLVKVVQDEFKPYL